MYDMNTAIPGVNRGGNALKDLSDEKLKQASLEIRAELCSREVAAYHEKNMQHVGKCFVARNCYSCPEKKSDYWNVYYMVLSLNDGNGVDVLQLQIDRDGNAFIQKTSSYVHLLGKKISRAAFAKAANKIVRHVAKMAQVSIEIVG